MTGPLRFAVFGDPVGHSRSPVMHAAALRATGLAGTYLRFTVPRRRLRDAVAMAKEAGFRGVNLTIPLKEEAFRVPGVRPTNQARRAGAINTLTFEGDGIEGDSTDGRGFLRSLAEAWSGWSPRDARVVLLGAGGAAKSVALALSGAGVARLEIVNRTRARAARLARTLPGRARVANPRGAGDWRVLLRGADLLINATSLGLRGEPSPVPAPALHPALRVADLIYNPPVTSLLAAARRAGCRVVNGEGMLVHQGALSFERWTGRPAPIAAMRRALRESLTLSKPLSRFPRRALRLPPRPDTVNS